VSEAYRRALDAFDRAAPTYDALYQASGAMAWLRRESLAVLQATFPLRSRLLEIGCGTGDEALALSRLGYQVVATDISPGMTGRARAKTQHGELPVTWLVLPAGELGSLLQDYGPGAFDGAYCSFGALNCEPHLDRVASALAGLLGPGASLVCSVMNRWCGWEIAWGLLHLRPRQAFRRLRREWIEAGLASPDGGGAVPVRYYTPRTFARAFEPYFRLRSLRGLPVLLPPPYLDAFWHRHPGLMARLEGADRRWRGRWPFSALGDHLLINLERTGSVPVERSEGG
jgi:SAM-dependent methyltransferase